MYMHEIFMQLIFRAWSLLPRFQQKSNFECKICLENCYVQILRQKKKKAVVPWNGHLHVGYNFWLVVISYNLKQGNELVWPTK